METGINKSLFTLLGVVVFGVFLSLSYFLFQDQLQSIVATTTEKTGLRTTRKTLKESMIDGIYVAIKENFYPSSAFTQKDYWFDSDTGQEWHGLCVTDAKDELFKSLEKWASSIK